MSTTFKNTILWHITSTYPRIALGKFVTIEQYHHGPSPLSHH